MTPCERASKAQPHHQQTHARRREDLDSILDAALDELDKEEEDDELSDDDNNDDDNNEASDNVERDKKNNNDDGIVSSSLRQIGIDYISDDNANYGAESSSSGDSSGGAPYSLEYLAAAKRERELMTASTAAAAARRQFFGPEPPPPPSPFDLHATNTSARAGIESEKEGGGDAAFASSSEFVSSLEDMMKQFAQEIKSVSGGGVGELDTIDEKSLDAMLKTMMFGMDGGGEQQAGNRVNKNVPPSSTKNEKSKNKSTNSRSSTANNNAINSNSSSNKTAPKRKKEPNNNDVDESINRLLNGINQASSPSSSTNNGNNNNNNSNPMMMGMAGIDPSQIEQFSNNIMSSIMSEFDKMGTKKDTDTVIDSVMKQLLNKELMYEPMKEVCNRFPTYLATNKDVLSIEEYQRYGNQYQYFQKICHIYETEPDNFVRLMELMQDIQEYGQPPVGIIKELAPDLQFDETGMPIMGSGGMPMMFPGMINGGGMPSFPGGVGGDEQCCIT